MKKTFILVCLSAMALSLAGCVEQTELSGETLPQKITVSGFVRYVEPGEDPELVNPGTPVNIYYGLPDEKGNVQFAVKTVAVDRDAFFEVEIGCPPAKALKVKIQSSMKGTSDAVDEDGKKTIIYFEATNKAIKVMKFYNSKGLVMPKTPLRY